MLLLGAAVLGLVVANTPLGPGLDELKHWHLPFPVAGLDLSMAHWVTDGLLVVFFFVAAIELRYELTQGELASVRRAIVPTVAAVGGVAAPAIIFLAIVPSELDRGWPIPIATDIAFALGVLALVGRRLPSRVRALLLALAIIDDLIGILVIAVFFTTELAWLPLGGAVLAVVAFALLGRAYRARRGSWPLRIAMVAIALLTWWLVASSGIHATIAGVALGAVLAPAPAESARVKLEPAVNGVVLPLFAFVAASVTIPQIPIAQLSPVFWAILVALPLGKLIGISIAGFGAQLATRVPKQERLTPAELLAVALLGGIGFTVSLLMNELAFRSAEEFLVEGTLGVLAGSLVAVVLGAACTALLARRYPAADDAAIAQYELDESTRRTDGR